MFVSTFECFNFILLVNILVRNLPSYCVNCSGSIVNTIKHLRWSPFFFLITEGTLLRCCQEGHDIFVVVRAVSITTISGRYLTPFVSTIWKHTNIYDRSYVYSLRWDSIIFGGEQRRKSKKLRRFYSSVIIYLVHKSNTNIYVCRDKYFIITVVYRIIHFTDIVSLTDINCRPPTLTHLRSPWP